MSEPTTPIDRRKAARRSPDPRDGLARVRLRGGREMLVVNISPFGALLDGDTRLLPGTHIDVHVITRQGRVLVRARVVRASVCRLRADAVGYEGGIAFDTVVNTTAHGYAIPNDDVVAGEQRTDYPPSAAV